MARCAGFEAVRARLQHGVTLIEVASGGNAPGRTPIVDVHRSRRAGEQIAPAEGSGSERGRWAQQTR